MLESMRRLHDSRRRSRPPRRRPTSPGAAPRPAGHLPVLLPLVLLATMAVGCASRTAVLEVSGSVMYEKPGIESVIHTIDDRRGAGGPARVSVTLVGDPGLTATFDITPGVANRRPMTETSDGHYVGEYAFAPDEVGGPYTIIGRLRHEQAGEAVVRDSEPIILSIPDRP